MDFLRRLIGGNDPADPVEAAPFDPAEAEAFERERELELLRNEAAGHDALIERQLKYARFAWQPPAQGGERRADDGEASSSD
jgi:hypothetical protein